MNDHHDLPSDATRGQLIDKVNDIGKDVAQLLEIFQTIKGGVRFFVITSKIVQWGAAFCVAIGTLIGMIFATYQFFKTGKLPYE